MAEHTGGGTAASAPGSGRFLFANNKRKKLQK
jgi:hypothetical protein